MHPKSTKKFTKKITERFLHFRHFTGPVITIWVVILFYSPSSRAQLGTIDRGGGAISGSVLIEGENQPAARVKVDLRPVFGGMPSTSYTDSNGHFEAHGVAGDAYVVRVAEPNYEPVEQTVNRTEARSGLVIYLRKTGKSPFERDGVVSVRDLKVPEKARREFEKGYQRLAKSDPDGGLKQFQKAVEIFPDYYDAYYHMGVADLELRRWEDAESSLQRAIELADGRHAQPYLALGALYCDKKAFPDAERVLHRALEIDASSSQGYVFLGQAVYGLNRMDEAEKHAQAALSRKSDEASAYLLLTNIHIKKNNYAMAQNDLEAYLKLKPNGPNSDQARATLAQLQHASVSSH